MANATIDSVELFNRLKSVFRKYGYEGATLSIISKAVGLKRASLYHRFPAGKQAMAEFVLAEVGKWIEENMVQLCYSNESPQVRLEKLIEKTSELYENGYSACIWRVFSLGESLKLFQPIIETQVRGLLSGFTHFFEEIGYSNAVAQRKSIDLLANLQGRLVLVSALGDVSIFQDYLAEMKLNQS
jgi:AcrR family transcriptional regulator